MPSTQLIVTQILFLRDGICTTKELDTAVDNRERSLHLLNSGPGIFLGTSTSMPAEFAERHRQTDQALLRARGCTISVSEGLCLVSEFPAFVPSVATWWCETIRYV